MTDQSGGGSPVWLGVALIFVGMASKDLFISNQQEFVSKDVKGSSITDEKLAGNSISFQYCYS